MKRINHNITTHETRYNIEALKRGLEVLEMFSAENPSISLMEIVQNLKLSKSTAFRVLSTLQTLGYIERRPDNRRYGPALKVLQLGFTALNSLEVRQVAHPYLEHLAQNLNETASLCVLEGMNVLYVDRVRNRSIVGVVLAIGSYLAAHCTSLGKILLADLPSADLENRIAQSELKPHTAHTIVDSGALLAELATVRRLGYAVDDEELAIGLRAVAAPIRDHSGKTIAAINVSGPVMSISRERLDTEIRTAVMQTAEQISLALGYLKAKG